MGFKHKFFSTLFHYAEMQKIWGNVGWADVAGSQVAYLFLEWNYGLEYWKMT